MVVACEKAGKIVYENAITKQRKKLFLIFFYLKLTKIETV
jgi:hypothetical protein